MNQLYTPPLIKNLIIINVLFFAAQSLLPEAAVNQMTNLFSLHAFSSEYFNVFQFVTSMFMHGSVVHLVTNMFALWMFGRILEGDLGTKRTIIYYFVCGVGAGLLHNGVMAIELSYLHTAVQEFVNTPSPDVFYKFVEDYLPGGMKVNESLAQTFYDNPNDPSFTAFATSLVKEIEVLRINIPTVGASGAIFGVLLAFGMLHPNDRIMLLIPPIPMKAKYFVMIYGALELYLGFSANDNIAHFAHLGGMIFGYILLRYWHYKNSRNQFNQFNRF